MTSSNDCPRCGSDTCPGQDCMIDCTTRIDGLTGRDEAIKALARVGPYMEAIDTVESAVRAGRSAVIKVTQVDGRWIIGAGWPSFDSDRLRVARQTIIDVGYFTEDEVGDDLAPRISELLFAIRDGKFDVRGAFGRDPEDGSAPVGYLTPEEHEVMDLSADLANALHGVVFGDGAEDNAVSDWNAVASDLHRVQHVVLAQAAARAYPDRYRLLGRALVRAEEEAPGQPIEHTDEGLVAGDRIDGYCGFCGYPGHKAKNCTALTDDRGARNG